MQRLTLIPVSIAHAAVVPTCDAPASGKAGVCLVQVDRGLQQAHAATTG